MKLFRLIMALALGWSVAACDLTDLDLLDNPNVPTPSSADVNQLYNSVQLNFVDFVETYWYETASISRMIANTGAYTYLSTFSPESFDGTWQEAYSQLFADIQALQPLAEDIGLDIHLGSAQIMKAYVLMALVDMFDNVPDSQALQGIDVASPMPDQGKEIYAHAMSLLDSAIMVLDGTDAARPTDNFYSGDASKWITLAKTLKFRAAMTTRLDDPAASTSMINALLTENDLIDSPEEDFQFTYGSERTNPNSRHPLYNDQYETGDGGYMSNYYMWLLKSEKINSSGNPVVDPRIRYYFYRQTENSADSDVNNYSCHFSNMPDQAEKPAHYDDVDPRMPYCIASSDGYWGRDHLNNEGIPPDGPLRTVYGLYPAGGQFDDNSFENSKQGGTTGARGQGIQPIMLSSYVAFLKAEAALELGTDGDPKALMIEGIEQSMEKVIGFSDLVPGTFAREIDNRGDVATVEELYKPTEEDIEDYIAVVSDIYDAESDKLNVVMKEYYIALWGNGLESYNMYRRTGKPNNMAPALEPGNTDFVNSFFLPAVHINRNASITEQRSHTDKVFWAENGPTLY